MAEPHWLRFGDADAPTGTHSLRVPGESVTPGSLVCDGRPICRGLLQPQVGQGMVTFSREQPPARGLVASLARGQWALVMLGGQAIGLGVEDTPFAALSELLKRRLQDFCALSDGAGTGRAWGVDPPQWAIGVDLGDWGSGDRSELARLAKAFRLGVQDLRQGVWVVDQLGGLHPDWPAGVHFEPQPA